MVPSLAATTTATRMDDRESRADRLAPKATVPGRATRRSARTLARVPPGEFCDLPARRRWEILNSTTRMPRRRKKSRVVVRERRALLLMAAYANGRRPPFAFDRQTAVGPPESGRLFGRARRSAQTGSPRKPSTFWSKCRIASVRPAPSAAPLRNRSKSRSSPTFTTCRTSRSNRGPQRGSRVGVASYVAT